MKRSNWFVLLAAALGGCAGLHGTRSSSDARGSENVRGEATPKVVRDDRTGALVRPDLGPEWAWSGAALPSGDPATSVLLVEKTAPVEVNASAPFTYTIKVTNIAADAELADVVVSDRTPAAGYEFESADPKPDRDGNVLRWNVGRLGVGESKTMTVRGKATSTGRVMACASATYTSLVCLSTNVVSPKLTLAMNAPAEVTPCDDVPLHFVVENPGTGAARRVTLTATLPEGWTVDGSRACDLDVGVLRGGESRVFDVVARPGKTGAFVTKAVVKGEGGLVDEASAKTAVRAPRLEIRETADCVDQILDRETKYTIVVANKGDAPARDTVVRHEISGADQICSVGEDGRADAGVVTWRLGTLAPGEERGVTLVARRSSAGSIAASSTARAYCAEAVNATAKTTYRGVPAVLLEVVDDMDPVPIDGTTTYSIVVKNQGREPDTDIAIECGLEDTVQYVSSSGPTKATVDGARIRFAPLARLDAKQTTTWTVTVRGVKPGDTRFRASMTTHELGRSVDETEATRVYR